MKVLMSMATLVVVAASVIVPNASAAFGPGILFDKAAAASQQFESSKGWYFTDLVNCAGTEAAIADQPLQISAENYLQYPVNGSCAGIPAPKNAGAGDLGVKWILQHAAPNTTNFSKCKERAWAFNSSATSYMQVTAQWSSLPCGRGLYRAKSVAKYNKNGTWHQGSQTTQAILK